MDISFKKNNSGAGEQFLLQGRMDKARVKGMLFTDTGILGWHYVSIATCLMRPHLFYVCMFRRVKDHQHLLDELFTTFEEHLRSTSSARQVVAPGILSLSLLPRISR